MDVLVIVDMQNDFINGSLGSDMAENIVDNVVKIASEFNGEIIFTRDTHQQDYLQTQEGQNLPVEHCIQGTKGWEICDKLQEISKNCVILDKPTFGSIDLPNKIIELAQNDKVDNITLVGLCTDICVISNAMLLKAYFLDTKIKVIENCCAGVTLESHNNALNSMKMCQIAVD